MHEPLVRPETYEAPEAGLPALEWVTPEITELKLETAQQTGPS